MIRGKISKEQIETYIQAKGAACPFCRSKDIHSSAIQMTRKGKGSSVRRCLNCKASWTEIWILSDIDETEIWINEEKL